MSSDSEPPDSKATTSHEPITAPPAPRQLFAPHNLFTAPEIAAALSLLKNKLHKYEGTDVSVLYKNGGRLRLEIENLVDITEIEDVDKIFVSFRYSDDSRVVGTLVDRPMAGDLSAEGGPLALAAAHACMDHLKSVRPQRAKWRGFIGGNGISKLLAAMSMLAAITCGGIIVIQRLQTSAPNPLIPLPQLVATLVAGVILSVVVIVILNKIQHHFGGTRVVRSHEVGQKFLTPEIGVLFGVIAVPIALLTLAFTVIPIL